MTTLTDVKFTTVADVGNWSGTSNLLAGGSGEAIGDLPFGGGTVRIILGIPNGIAAIPDGSEFISLKVDWEAKLALATSATTQKAYLTGGNEFNSTLTASYQNFSLDGDAAYWGLSGTNSEIFAGLKDGSIDFYGSYQGITGDDYYVREVYATLTYVTPDTKRASLLIPINA